MSAVASAKHRFRITSNGIGFRVERFTAVGHLWWRRDKWLPLCYPKWRGPATPMEFRSLVAAQDAVASEVKKFEALQRGWHPVKTTKKGGKK